MTVATQRAALAALIAAVPNVGIVNDYERYARDESKFKAAYVYTPAGGDQQVRGWRISNTAVQERSLGVKRVLNVMTWQVRGYMSLADDEGSEKVFDDLVEAIRTAYRANPTLGGICAAEPLGEDDGMQKVDAGPVLFCGVLCHSVLLEVKLCEYL